MDSGDEGPSIRDVIEDVRCRTLAGIRGDIAKLIYLASTRDYSTGRYYHDGLAWRFTGELAERALEFSHREIFERLVFSPLEDITEEVGSFIQGTHEPLQKVVRTWQELEPYRVTIPQDSAPGYAELFFSNIKIALAILEAQEKPDIVN